MARSTEMAVVAWGVLGGGALTGKYNQPTEQPRRYERTSEAYLDIAVEIGKVANELGRKPSQIAINWVRQQQDKSLIIPIIGARTESQMRANLGCLEFELSKQQPQRLNDASPIDLGFPRTFLESDNVNNLVFGKTHDLIDNHRSGRN